MLSTTVHVIGRGICGLTVAEQLTRYGVSVVLWGPSQVPGTASRAAVGLSAVKGRQEGATPRSRAQLRAHRGLETWLSRVEAQSGQKIPRQFCGVFELFADDAEFHNVQARVFGRRNQAEHRARRFDSHEFAQQCPLGPLRSTPLQGSYFFPDDGCYDPGAALQALEILLRARGARFCEKEVERLAPGTSGGFSVQTTGGRYEAAEVCLAAGVFSDKILENSGIYLERQIPAPGVTLNGRAPEEMAAVAIEERKNLVVENARFRFGATTRPREKELTEEMKSSDFEELSSVVSRRWQRLEPVDFLWGIRSRFRDRNPAVGPLPVFGDRRLWLATGFYKSGMQLAHLFADSLVSRMMGTEDPDPLFDEFLPTRLGLSSSSQ